MASSLPVVVSDISGYNELVVDGRRGILFEKGNAESLAFALNKTINNSKLTEKLIEEGKNFSKNYVSFCHNKYKRHQNYFFL